MNFFKGMDFFEWGIVFCVLAFIAAFGLLITTTAYYNSASTQTKESVVLAGRVRVLCHRHEEYLYNRRGGIIKTGQYCGDGYTK